LQGSHEKNANSVINQLNKNLSGMTHIVALDEETNEIDSFIKGTRTMLIRGSDTIRIPYGFVSEGDILYFTDSHNCNEIKARAIVSSVFNSYPLSVEESYEMIIRNQDRLLLPDKLFYKWAGKRYLVLIGITNCESVHPGLVFQKTMLSNNGWATQEHIENQEIHNQKTA
jgi:hypothetical protein